ncbi:MAG: type II toxin-antitoxin system prevent-host-death family antitoxin [Chromatiaceae bacterium]
MEQVLIAQAKAHLSALLQRVETGEEIFIARRGKAITRLVPEPPQPRTAAAALAPVWALGGFDLEPIPEPPFDTREITLD